MLTNHSDPPPQDTTPVFYFTVNNPANPMAVAKTAIRTHEHLYWDAHIPDGEIDHELAVASLSIATGEPRGRISNLILAFHQLAELPLLHQLQHRLFHLDLQRLIVISNALFGLDPEHLPVIDEHLTGYLTPTAPNQSLPTAGAIRNRIKAIRDMVDDPRATGTTAEKDFTVSFGADGNADLYASLSEVDGHVVEEAVKKHARATGKTEAEAFRDLVLGNINIQVILNLYRANDLAESPVWANGVGWLDATSGEHWAGRADKHRDIDATRDKHLTSHDPSPDITAAVEGRDDTCSFPNCRVKAMRCDLDHRVNHADGGCTCVGNLKGLCRHHHNGKTSGRIKYLFDPVTGIGVWLLVDGTWAVTVPEGPLTPTSARWAQTVSQYRTKHRARWAAAAKAEGVEVQDEEAPF